MHEIRIVLVALCWFLPANLIHAQSVTEFYRGKTIDLVIGYTVGGAYDNYARLLARHMGRFIPGNPTIVPRNMPGVGSFRAANWLYSVAPKDGTVFGTVSRAIGTAALLNVQGARVEPDKLSWIGSANNEVGVCVSWHTSGINNLDDLMKRELIIAATGMSDTSGEFPKVLNELVGTKFKLVMGYPAGNEMTLAIERGEVQGRCDWSWGGSIKTSRMQWVNEKKINILVQVGLAKHPDLPEVPLAIDLGKNDEQKQVLRLLSARQVMGRPFVGPPGVPADRVEALQKAFMDTVNSKEYIEEAQKMRLELNPVSGPELVKLVTELYRTPPAIVRKAIDLIK